jgi:hypothetical protein
MRSIVKKFSITLCALLPLAALAQVTISSEIRPRTEYLHGFGTLAAQDQDAAFFTSQRSRLNFGLQQKKTQVYICLQDVRVWGNQPQMVVADGATTTVHEAWAKTMLDSNWSMKLGRQEIYYDDQRIFGNVLWAQQARSHDAALFMYKKKQFTGHLGLAFNQAQPMLIGTSYLVRNYKSMQYVWLNKSAKHVKISFLALNNGIQVTDTTGEYHTNYSQTAGTRLVYDKKGWKFNAAAYYQLGVGADPNETDIQAYYGAAEIGYFKKKPLGIIAGAEVLSGNDFVNPNGTNNAFMPFYGTNHKFNGYMDYFYVGNHAGSVGLNDVYIKGVYTFKNKLKAMLDFHYFMTNGKLGDPENGGSAADPFLGTEVDLVLVKKINDNTTCKVGYSQLLASNTMEILKGGDANTINNWAWVMVSFKPGAVQIGKK